MKIFLIFLFTTTQLDEFKVNAYKYPSHLSVEATNKLTNKLWNVIPASKDNIIEYKILEPNFSDFILQGRVFNEKSTDSKVEKLRFDITCDEFAFERDNYYSIFIDFTKKLSKNVRLSIVVNNTFNACFLFYVPNLTFITFDDYWFLISWNLDKLNFVGIIVFYDPNLQNFTNLIEKYEEIIVEYWKTENDYSDNGSFHYQLKQRHKSQFCYGDSFREKIVCEEEEQSDESKDEQGSRLVIISIIVALGAIFIIFGLIIYFLW